MEYDNLMEEMKAKYYPYASQSRNLTETLEKINAAIEKVKADGTLDALAEKYGVNLCD